MPIESLTYADLAQRLGCTPDAARSTARRKRWPRSTGNDGKTRCLVDLTDVRPPADPRSTTRPPDHAARIAVLEAELAEAREVGARSRADYERERDRCDRLVAELKTLADLLATAMAPKPRPSLWRRLAGLA